MPAVLPWRRGPAAHWHRLGLRLAPARASRRPHGAGASGCLEQKEGAGAGRVPGGPQPAAQDHLGEAPQTSLTRSTAWTLAPHPEAPQVPHCAEPPQAPVGAGGHGRRHGLLSSCTVPFQWVPLFKLSGPSPGVRITADT